MRISLFKNVLLCFTLVKKNTDHLLHLESEPRLEEEALYREDKSHLEFT